MGGAPPKFEKITHPGPGRPGLMHAVDRVHPADFCVGDQKQKQPADPADPPPSPPGPAGPARLAGLAGPASPAGPAGLAHTVGASAPGLRCKELSP
eukprot:gene11141-biopygen18371